MASSIALLIAILAGINTTRSLGPTRWGSPATAGLWRYHDSSSGSDFWSVPTICNGHAYFGNQDGTMYAFGT